jgi:hypothetical protein
MFAKHKKRGTTYEIVGGAMVQTDKPLNDMDSVVVYQCRETGELWVRRREEFFDGRFIIAEDAEALGRVGDDFNLELQSLYNTDHAKLRAMLEINDTLKITKHPTLRRHLLTRIREAIRALGKE